MMVPPTSLGNDLGASNDSEGKGAVADRRTLAEAVGVGFDPPLDPPDSPFQTLRELAW